jgi:hypothetical protein
MYPSPSSLQARLLQSFPFFCFFHFTIFLAIIPPYSSLIRFQLFSLSSLELGTNNRWGGGGLIVWQRFRLSNTNYPTSILYFPSTLFFFIIYSFILYFFGLSTIVFFFLSFMFMLYLYRPNQTKTSNSRREEIEGGWRFYSTSDFL